MYQAFLDRIFEKALNQQASDIHFCVGKPPVLRIDRDLLPLKEEKVLTPEDLENIAFLLLQDKKEEFLKEKELDFSYDYQRKARFRVNTYFQQGYISIALRFIPARIRNIEELNLPPILHRFAQLQQGLVLVVGPASHGKTTTLAAIVDEINHTRASHIITIEDPIEYVFYPDKCLIDQREVGRDTKSFLRALKSSLRQDPDVLVVGEMRDYRSIAIALTAAETGHLVLSTLHTNSAAQTIDRIIDVFPAEQQAQVRAQLASTLSGIISQRLLKRTKGGVIPACEVLIGTPAVANVIREKRTHEIDMIISTSREEGMISLNASLASLVLRREVKYEEAEKYSLDPKGLRALIIGK